MASATNLSTSTGPEVVKRLGPEPQVLSLVLDSGATIELAAPTEAQNLLAGPFGVVLLEFVNRMTRL